MTSKELDRFIKRKRKKETEIEKSKDIGGTIEYLRETHIIQLLDTVTLSYREKIPTSALLDEKDV